MKRKLLQINITANWGSHGKIAEGIGELALENGWESYIAYGRRARPSQSQLYHIGNMFDELLHGAVSRIADNHGLMSCRVTNKLVQYIDNLQPDIIHLHNIHGYYLNYPVLFRYFAKRDIPVVWTLHDCWPFTGHCAHYMFVGCQKWKTHCEHCPQKGAYPKSIFLDRSYQNFEKKKYAFLSLKHLTLVPVSKWLQNELKASFFQEHDTRLIYNGIDTNLFHPEFSGDFIRQKYNIPSNNRIVLGVASNWYRKGLEDFIKLRAILDGHYSIVLVGLKERERKKITKDIIGIEHTENQEELVALYSAANVFFNPTWEDNFPTTNLESMACGTPVVTYKTGGSPEAIGKGIGYVIKQGDIELAKKTIMEICLHDKEFYKNNCRQRILNYFNMNERFSDYITLYNEILKD